MPVSESPIKREFLRTQVQVKLDAEKTSKERNEWGQFATPPELADDIVGYILDLVGDEELTFLEPSCGSGSFFSSLLRLGVNGQLESATGIELDERFALVADQLWGDLGLSVERADFLDWSAHIDARYNLLIANPPYVRHHHIAGDRKKDLVDRAAINLGLKVSGLSGLYLHFVLQSHRLLSDGALSAWLIPSEFMDVNYGSALREYLSTHVSLIRLHRFDPSDVQFDDALVSSAVMIFRNVRPHDDDEALFTFGGSVRSPRETHTIRLRELDSTAKWSSLDTEQQADGPLLSDFFTIRRGIATGANSFFILERGKANEMGIDHKNLKPILPSPRNIASLEVKAEPDGWPSIEPQPALIDCRLSEHVTEMEDPALAAYLTTAADHGIKDRYLLRKRDPWYRQEERAPAPFLCTYMGRGRDLDRPFRFILNFSEALVTNMYLMLYPSAHLEAWIGGDTDRLRAIHEALLSLTGADLRRGGRVYGGGLHKMEPKELASLSARKIERLDPAMLSVPSVRDQMAFPFD